MKADGGSTEVDFESLLITFEKAWRSRMPPNLDDFLSPPYATPGDDLFAARAQELMELIPLDLEYRWREPASRLNGPLPTRPRLEDYFLCYPELVSRSFGAPSELVEAEYRIRRIWGDRPSIGEYLVRFPALAGILPDALSRIDGEIAREYPGRRRDETTPLIALAMPGKLLETTAGLMIEGFELLGELGRGAMGIVYKARDRKLGRIVAIKTLAEGRFATQEQIARFHAEAHAIARLRHSNIIAIHAIGELDARPFLSLEFAEGGSLAQRLAEKPMAPREAATLIEALAGAVHTAHKAGIVHRDLKPSNVLLTADLVAKVSDFGLAKLLDTDSGRTLSGQVMGTPAYMAPEQALGHAKQVGPAADTYALGAILYQALTGRPPFLGESGMETLKLVTSSEVVAPHLLRPDVPRDLETICLKCLEKEPHKRYPSAEALAQDVGRFLENRPITARPVGPAGRFGRWSRRNPVVAGLSATVVATLVVGILLSAILTIRARRAEREARSAADVARRERGRAESEAEISRAVNEFLNKELLAQASSEDQATLDVKADPDLKVRALLDRAAGRIKEKFGDKPLVEASIRRTIGETYAKLGLVPLATLH